MTTKPTWNKRTRSVGDSERAYETLAMFGEEQRKVRFIVTKVRYKMRTLWAWRAYAYVLNVAGTLGYDVTPAGRYDTQREACASAERAALTGFYWHDGEWLPCGTTNDFPDGIQILK
jgi:hypothetical protein